MKPGVRLLLSSALALAVAWIVITEYRAGPGNGGTAPPANGGGHPSAGQPFPANPGVAGPTEDPGKARAGNGGVEIRVLMPDGKPAEFADIEWASGTLRSRIGWIPGMVPPPAPPYGRRAYQLRAFQGEWLRSAPVAIDLQAQGAGPVVLRLESLPGIIGSVRFSAGLRAQSAMVMAVPDIGAGPPDPRQPRTDWLSTGVSSEVPAFSFRDLAPGTWYLVIPGRGIWKDLVQRVEVVGGQAQVELRIPALASDVLTIKVLGPDGRDLRELRLEVVVVKDPPPLESGAGQEGQAAQSQGHSRAGSQNVPALEGMVLEGPDGRRLFRLNDAGRAALRGSGGALVVLARSESFGLLAVRVPETASGEHLELTLAFREPVRPEFRVTPSDPSLSAEVWLSPGDSVDKKLAACLPTFKGEAIADGRLRFPVVQPGAYKLAGRFQINFPGTDQYIMQDLSAMPVELEPGTKDLILPVPRLYSVSTEIGRGVLAELEGKDSLERAFTLGVKSPLFPWTTIYKGPIPSGFLALPGLPAGEYALGVEGVKGGMRFRIPFEGVLRFTPEKEAGAAIRVNLAEAPEALVAAGCKDGDRIVGGEMELFTWKREAAEYLEEMLLSCKSQPQKMVLRRGPQSLTIEVDLRGVAEPQLRACFIVE